MTTVATFDSGVGGLSVWRHLVELLPQADHLYLADQAYAPYGHRSLEEVRDRALAIGRFLVDQGADEIVVACNTASAAGLKALRAAFPHLPIVGMEPAVKPAIQATNGGTIAVLATEATFQGELYRSLIDSYGPRVEIVQLAGTGLADLVEGGKLEGDAVEAALAPLADEALRAGADVVVLGCTHYPFLRPSLERLIGPGVAVIDPSTAVARQAFRRFPSSPVPAQRDVRILTTGPGRRLQAQLHRLLGQSHPVEEVAINGPAARG